MSEPGPHLRVWLKAGLDAPTEWGFLVSAGQMRNSIWGARKWNVCGGKEDWIVQGSLRL
jgi:hypothetical protein